MTDEEPADPCPSVEPSRLTPSQANHRSGSTSRSASTPRSVPIASSEERNIDSGQDPLPRSQASTDSHPSDRPRHRSHSSSSVRPPSQHSPLPALDPSLVHRSYSIAQLRTLGIEGPCTPALEAGEIIQPPAYSGRQSRLEEKRPMRQPDHAAGPSSPVPSPDSLYVAHVATDDKAILGHIATLGSAPEIASSLLPSGPSAPPLLWDQEPGPSAPPADQPQPDSVLPAPSTQFVSCFDPCLEPEHHETEKRAWELVVGSSAPRDSDGQTILPVATAPAAPPYEPEEEES